MLLRMEGSPGCASERTSRHRGSVYFGGTAAVAMLLLTTTTALAAGGAWTIVSSPNSTPVQPEVLNSVSCTSPTFCMAVGQYAEFPPPSNPANQTLIEEWNGTSWSIVPSPSPSQIGPNKPLPGQVGNYLNGVSCTSPSFCMAVGYDIPSSGDETLIEAWNGSAWSLVASPDPTGLDFLDSVSCTSPTFCVAVGYDYPNGSSYENLIEQWNGTSWSVINVPDTGLNTEDALNGVSCITETFCMSAGWAYATDGSASQALFAEWDGANWLLVPSPVASAPYNYPYGVSCSAVDHCAAVGSTYTPSTSITTTLVEAWDGTGWNIVAAPNAAGSLSSLSGVSCSSASFCMADGVYSNGSVTQTFIENWDGGNWSIVSSPVTSSSESSALYGVDCMSSAFCMAVGAYNLVSAPTTAISQTRIEEWQSQPEASVPETPWAPGLPLIGLALVAGVLRIRSGAWPLSMESRFMRFRRGTERP